VKPWYGRFQTLWRRLRLSKRIAIFVGLGVLLLSVSKTACYAFFRPSHLDRSHPAVREDLAARRRYLIHAVTDLSSGKMPWYLPDQFKGEWLAVTYSMTAMALVNLSRIYPDTVGESAQILDQMAAAMETDDVTSFDRALWNEDPLSSLDGPHGHIGYLGHLAIVLVAKKYVNPASPNDQRLRSILLALHRRMLDSPWILAETYPGQIFVADNAVVVASLSLAQPLFPDVSLDISERWVRSIQRRYLDPDTGLMVFRVGTDGSVIEKSRGSGVAWSIFYLSYAHDSFARQQYQQLRSTLLSQPFGLFHGIREVPVGNDWQGDVDSGPVLFGLSPSATGFAIAGAVLTGDDDTTLHLLRTAEWAGTTVSTGQGRRYLLAPLVGDAILLAMRTVTPWRQPVP